MLKAKNICRVCSSRGAYDIFAVIPAYLHASSNEFLLWKKDIAKLLEETTGLTINPNDNLPKKICALCISYLKHASTFRTQAINNYLSLQAAEQILNEETVSSESKISSRKLINNATNILNYIDDDDDADGEILTNLPNNTRKNTPHLTKQRRNDEELTNNMNTYLNLLFNKDTNKTANSIGNNQRKNQSLIMQQSLHTFDLEDDAAFLAKDFEFDELPSVGSSDENEIIGEQTINNFFNYKETNFEEDDIINILKDYNVTINIPETDKERKCNSCFRRFMFEDTYLDHIEICVEHKLQTTVQALNRLYGLRRKKMISPHEFIRRMFFSFKKISEWIGTLVIPDANATIKNEIDLLDINNKNDDIIEQKNTTRITNINWKTNNLIKQQEFDMENQILNSKMNNDMGNQILNSKMNNDESKETNCINNPLLEILKTNSSKSQINQNLSTVQSFPNNINVPIQINTNFTFPLNNMEIIKQDLKNKIEHENIIALFED